MSLVGGSCPDRGPCDPWSGARTQETFEHEPVLVVHDLDLDSRSAHQHGHSLGCAADTARDLGHLARSPDVLLLPVHAIKPKAAHDKPHTQRLEHLEVEIEQLLGAVLGVQICAVRRPRVEAGLVGGIQGQEGRLPVPFERSEEIGVGQEQVLGVLVEGDRAAECVDILTHKQGLAVGCL